MEELNHMDPASITPKHIDIQRVLAAKGVKLPGWLTHWVERLLHLDEVNHCIYVHRERFGMDFVCALLDSPRPDGLDIKVDVVGAENLPREGFPIIAGNHPLGGPDGLALMRAIGPYRTDIKFPVNDFLLYIPGLAPLFVPIDKVHRNAANASTLEDAFADRNALLYFPAGLCSRKRNGEIRDLPWKKTFITKSVETHRDVVPIHFGGRNSDFFYRLSNISDRLVKKVNIAMLFLVDEMFKNTGNTFPVKIGKPIPWQTFDHSKTPAEWAAYVQDEVYKLKL